MTTQEIEAALRTKLETAQAQDELGHRLHLTIAEVLTRFEGKKLTKRFTDKATEAIKALFPDQHPVCSWEHPGKVSFWVHNTIPYEQRLVIYVAPTYAPTNPAYQGHWIGECHAAGFEREDLCYGEAAVERIAQRKELLTPTPRRQGCQVQTIRDLAYKVSRVQTAWKELDTYTEPLLSELRYEAKRLTGLKETYGRN